MENKFTFEGEKIVKGRNMTLKKTKHRDCFVFIEITWEENESAASNRILRSLIALLRTRVIIIYE